jgi:hypothetical protein
MKYRQLTPLEADDLGFEISARMEFQHAFEAAARETLDRLPSAAEEVLEMWVGILQSQQALVIASAAFIAQGARPTIKVVGQNEGAKEEWELLAGSEVMDGLTESLLSRRTFRRFARAGGAGVPEGLGEAYILVSPIPDSHPPTALAVATRSHRISLVLEALDTAGLHAGLAIAIIRKGEERERGYRQMAERISYMCSSSVVLAQYRLRALCRPEGGLPDGVRESLEKAMEDLEEAQSGFDRARLLAFPWTQYEEDISLGELLGDILDSLRDVVAAPGSAQRCRKEARSVVRGARIRLWYAFRDLILLACLLGKKKLSVDLRSGPGDIIQVHVRGGPSALRIPPARDVLEFLCSPETYLVAHDKHAAERVIGLQLARALIKEVGGRLSVRLGPDSLEFGVNLPAAGQKHQ